MITSNDQKLFTENAQRSNKHKVKVSANLKVQHTFTLTLTNNVKITWQKVPNCKLELEKFNCLSAIGSENEKVYNSEVENGNVKEEVEGNFVEESHYNLCIFHLDLKTETTINLLFSARMKI